MMKLGSQTASALNHIMSRQVIGQPKPREGMGATLLGWTDRHAATIAAVIGPESKAPILRVQQDRATMVGGSCMSESQAYTFERNPAGAEYYFRMEPNGTWQEVTKNAATGRFNKVKGGKGLRIGERDEYYDPSF